MMVDIETIVTVVSVLVALGSLVVAIVVWNRNRDNDIKSETKDMIEAHTGLQSQIDVTNKTIATRLDAIDNGVRDLKADNRGFRSELTKMRDDLRDEMREIHDEARHGVELAEAAHRRLDRLGAEPDILAQRIRKGD